MASVAAESSQISQIFKRPDRQKVCFLLLRLPVRLPSQPPTLSVSVLLDNNLREGRLYSSSGCFAQGSEGTRSPWQPADVGTEQEFKWQILKARRVCYETQRGGRNRSGFLGQSTNTDEAALPPGKTHTPHTTHGEEADTLHFITAVYVRGHVVEWGESDGH